MPDDVYLYFRLPTCFCHFIPQFSQVIRTHAMRTHTRAHVFARLGVTLHMHHEDICRCIYVRCTMSLTRANESTPDIHFRPPPAPFVFARDSTNHPSKSNNTDFPENLLRCVSLSLREYSQNFPFRVSITKLFAMHENYSRTTWYFR